MCVKNHGASWSLRNNGRKGRQDSMEGDRCPTSPLLHTWALGTQAVCELTDLLVSPFIFYFLFFNLSVFQGCLHQGIPPQRVLRCQAEEIQSVSTMNFASLFQKLQRRCLISRNTKACVPGQLKPVLALTLGLVRFFSSVPLLASVCHGEWPVE